MYRKLLFIVAFVCLTGCSPYTNNQQGNASGFKPTLSAQSVTAKPTNASLQLQYDLAVDSFKFCFMENALSIAPAEKRKNGELLADRVFTACSEQLSKIKNRGIDLFIATSNMTYENAQAATSVRIAALSEEYREKITGNKQREDNKKEMQRNLESAKLQQTRYGECLETAIIQKYMLSGTAADVTNLILTECDAELRAWAKFKITAIGIASMDNLSLSKSREDQDQIFQKIKSIRKEMWNVVLTEIISKRSALQNTPRNNPAPNFELINRIKEIDI